MPFVHDYGVFYEKEILFFGDGLSDDFLLC